MQQRLGTWATWGLAAATGDPQGEGRLGTTGNGHGSTGDGPGLLERGEDAHGAGYLVDRWRDGYCSCSDPTADLFRSSEKASLSREFSKDEPYAEECGWVEVPRRMLLEKSNLAVMIVVKAAQTRQHGSNFSNLVAR